MPTVTPPPQANVETMLDHAWFLEDQKVAFSSAPFSSEAISVSCYLSDWLWKNSYKSSQVRSTLYIKDSQISVCLLNQSLDFLQRAIGNAVSHYVLARKGLETWARITNYYAGYFSVHGLLCLQGRTITRLRLDKSIQIQLVPVNLREHIFAITTLGSKRNPHHQTPWKNFYDIYDKYTVSHSAYGFVTKKINVVDPLDESNERNNLNYPPFVGFAEIRKPDRIQEFLSLFENYTSTLEQKDTLDEFLNDLRIFTTDPECKYFARTLLKIALIGDIFLSLRVVNSALQEEWTSRVLVWNQFLSNLFSGPANCYLLKFIPLIGTKLS